MISIRRTFPSMKIRQVKLSASSLQMILIACAAMNTERSRIGNAWRRNPEQQKDTLTVQFKCIENTLVQRKSIFHRNSVAFFHIRELQLCNTRFSIIPDHSIRMEVAYVILFFRNSPLSRKYQIAMVVPIGTRN